METKKKQFKMPHTFVIIGIIILFAVLLTWIIPAGSYTRFENEAGIKVIDPNDFNYIDKTPVNPLEIPLYIVNAFIKRIDLMLVIMFAGGAFHILTKTGALHAVVAKMAKIFSTRIYLFLPILTLVFGLICTTQGVNLFIAFAPIMVMMAFAMGLDSITGVSIILLGGAIGFSTGPLNINTTIVAQKIAGLPEALLAADQEHCIRMPMRDTCRSLNLSNSVAVGVYEVLRQWDFPELLDHGHLRDYEWK